MFSDKTGTLTENQMDFKKCSVNGITYAEEELDVAMVGTLRFSRTLIAVILIIRWCFIFTRQQRMKNLIVCETLFWPWHLLRAL